jgi:hypothetical protein
MSLCHQAALALVSMQSGVYTKRTRGCTNILRMVNSCTPPVRKCAMRRAAAPPYGDSIPRRIADVMLAELLLMRGR